jgi:hypothetical protein
MQLNKTNIDDKYEEILNLDVNSLDTLNRFIRLSQKLGWSYTQLDWVLRTVSVLTKSTDIVDSTFEELAKIRKLENEYSLSIDLLVTLWYDIKTIGVGDSQFSEALFDKIFNGPEQIGSIQTTLYHPKYPNDYLQFINPLYQSVVQIWNLTGSTKENADSIANTIVSSIPTSNDNIRQIAIAIFGEVYSIDLDVPNLSALYRHAILAKELNLQIQEYLLLLKLLGITTDKGLICSFITPDQTILIVESLIKIKASNLNAFLIDYICNGNLNSYVNTGYSSQNIPSLVSSLNVSLKNMLLKPNNFTGYGITVSQSETIYNWLLNNSYIDNNGLILNSKVLTDADIPNPFPDTKSFNLSDEQKTFIVSTEQTFSKNQDQSFKSAFASFLNQKEDFITLIVEQVQTLLQIPNYLQYFIDNNIDFIDSFIENCSRFIILYKDFSLNNTQTSDIIQTPNGFNQKYSVDKIKFKITLSIDNINEIYIFTQLEKEFNDKKNLLIQYLNNVKNHTNDSFDELSNITNWHKDQLIFLSEYFFGKNNKNEVNSATNIEQIFQLNSVFKIIQKLGIDVYIMSQLNDISSWTSSVDNWDLYNKYSQTLLQNVRANTSTDAWSTTFKKINSKIEDLKRDALLSLSVYEMNKIYSDITTPNNLYEFLLIDVKKSGCTDISYIKEALNASQLYLQRCRLNLEQNAIINKADLPDVYWEWIMNYRVWQANREVFLYPENYIDPSLRKSKTDLFGTLENDLKQGNINKETVEASYKKYLDSFQELATLKYVDGYRCYTNGMKDEQSDTFFLFARTQVEPYQYYYITRTKGDIWSQWQPVNISINSANVTSIYAFNKLFIFWIETTVLTENDTTNNNIKRTNVKISVKYSFYNFSGDWTQPQTLVKDKVIYVSGCEDFINKITNDKGETLPSNLFDLSQIYWQKVNAINISTKSYWKGIDDRTKSDKILITFGPLIDTMNYSKDLIIPSIDTKDLVAVEFEESLNSSVANINQVRCTNNNLGYVQLSSSIVLEESLNKSFLIYPEEFILIEKNQSNQFPNNIPFIDEFNQSLYLLNSDCIIKSNYMPATRSDSFEIKPVQRLNDNSFESIIPVISTSTSNMIYKQLADKGYIDQNGNLIMANIDFKYLQKDLESILIGQPNEQAMISYVFKTICTAIGTPVLFSKLNSSQDSIININNDPYSFILNHGTESYLITDDNATPYLIDTQIEILEVLFTKVSFETETITSDASSLIFTGLINNGYMDAEGRFFQDAGYDDTVDVLKQILSGQPNEDIMIQESINIIFHQQKFYQDSFIIKGIISSNASSLIYTGIQQNGYMDKNGRINANYSMQDIIDALKNILAGQPNQNKMINEVVTIILKSIKSSSIKYFNSSSNPVNANICGYNFNTVRLTTSAIKRLSSTLFSKGIDGLLSLTSQQVPVESGESFDKLGSSPIFITPPSTIDADQVDFSGVFGNYYWELFFHGPMLVSQILNTNQQFQDAENWLQYIFNPTLSLSLLETDSFETDLMNSSDSLIIYNFCQTGKYIDGKGFVAREVYNITPLAMVNEMKKQKIRLQTNINVELTREILAILQNNYMQSELSRYWQFNPFRNHTLETLTQQLTNPSEIYAYNRDPFDPHTIARLRIGAYEKTIVMKYVQNLINWGDSEFRIYTWESITSALMLYIYAYDLLGSKPQDLGPCLSEFPVNFSEILKKYASNKDGIPQFLIDLENAISLKSTYQSQITYGEDIPFNDIEAYFCVPENEKFILNWDIIENRLYNIRHCLNIDGIATPLALFEPPINPMELVKAATSGNNVLGISSLTQPNIPAYRFDFMIEKAKSLTSTLIQLGNNLLSVLEKRDEQSLSLLQSTNELNILNLTTQIKKQQIQEQEEQLAGLQQSLLSAKNRETYYSNLLSKGLNPFEISDLELRTAAIIPQEIAIGINGVSIAGYLAPNIFGFSDGGMKFGDAIMAGAQISSLTSEILNQTAGIVSTGGSYVRRAEEWKFQKENATYDVSQITNNINANQFTIENAKQEIIIHKKNIEQSQSVDSFLKSKFSNKDLYQWMISRISSLYFQTYNLAQSMALKAQAAYQFELDSSEQMITFNYWDDLYKGLLSGESLMLSLEQMESFYIQKNTRLLEIEKNISLANEFTEEFFKFKWGHNNGEQGLLDFTLSQKLFDFDFPSHYCRKIKSISISIPAVVGPYQSINATLRQNSNMVIMNPNIDAVKYAIAKSVSGSGDIPEQPSSSILRQNWVANQSIATSKGVNDTGMFILNFNDIQYLPFENTGAVSTWSLSLPPSTNKINFDSISDVIINIKYTALDGGTNFENQVKTIYSSLPNSVGDYIKIKTFDLKQAFANNWMQMFDAKPDSNNEQSITFDLTDNYWLTNLNNVNIEKFMIQLEVSDDSSITGNNFLKLKVDMKNSLFSITDNFSSLDSMKLQDIGFGIDSKSCTLSFNIDNTPTSITKTENSITVLDDTKLLNIAVLIEYTEKAFS